MIQTFIVLDLETTGLDTDNDAIMEIAAIRFTLEKDSIGKWQAKAKEEKTMLINPERPLSEEIALITHITDDMLMHKPVWDEVREKVSAFIGESIIIGHNVLFDVAMLRTHGVDLRENTILDTFELSEFFSSESESLNLGFLGAFYGLKTDKGEHRALGDVEICLALFLRYLEYAEGLSELEQSILRLIASKEEKNNIGFFLKILNQHSGDIYTLNRERNSPHLNQTHQEIYSSHTTKNIVPRVISLSSDKEEEINLLKEALKSNNGVHILTPGYKVAISIETLLQELGYQPMIGIRSEKWCSFRYLDECINTLDIWERKLSILIGRILLWLEKTETGLLTELKTYGKEYEYIDNFRMEDDEVNCFSLAYKRLQEESQIIIYDIYDYIQMKHPKPDCLIVKDIGLADDKIRRALSTLIDISLLIDEIEYLFSDTIAKERLIYALSLIQHIYEGIPERPKGEKEFAPGAFGETYFFDQKMLWKAGGTGLLLASRIIESYMHMMKLDESQPISISKRWKKVIESLTFLVSYHTYTSSCTSIIIEISEKGTLMRYIPRILEEPLEQLFEQGAMQSILLYGYGIGGKKATSFLKSELHISAGVQIEGKRLRQELTVIGDLRSLELRGGVILTTSMKHIREIGKTCEKMGIRVLMQGISGGKSKILSLFTKNYETTVLIGLIDTWKDEYELWSISKNIVIAKLPFDPPSDPYYLGRTAGMSNNFSLYSEPMVIIRINTLIGRIRSATYLGPIYTLDTRLLDTVWGGGIMKELL